MEDNKFASRKFLLAVQAIGILTVFRLIDKLPPSDFMNGLVTIFGIYAGANVVSKMTGK